MAAITTAKKPAATKVVEEKVGNSNGGEGRKAPVASGRPKLRWHVVDDKTGEKAAEHNGVRYALVPMAEGKWKATVRKDGKLVTLIEGVSGSRAYAAASNFHHYDKLPEIKASKAKTAA